MFQLFKKKIAKYFFQCHTSVIPATLRKCLKIRVNGRVHIKPNALLGMELS